MKRKPNPLEQTVEHVSNPDTAKTGTEQSSLPVSIDQTPVESVTRRLHPGHASVGTAGSDHPTLPGPLNTDADSPAKRQRPTTDSRNRFSILCSHARGGLGEVYVARDHELERDVALKEIQSRFSDNITARERFVLEARVTGGLEHPGIVPVYGFGTHADGRPFYAMRFIRGQSMKEAIEAFHRPEANWDPAGQRLAFRALLGQFVATCNAIAYAHSRGILHRDIKPANIMLGEFGETLVVDWGLAKSIGTDEIQPQGEEITLSRQSGSPGSVTRHGSMVGTPAFMSPEQAAGKLNEMHHASDIYSLGATLYVLMTGQPSFPAHRAKQVVGDIIAGSFPAPRTVRSDVPKPLEAVCLKAMALRPADRYPSARALANDVQNWMADEPVTAYSENALQRAGRWLRNHRTASLVGLAILVSLAVAASVGMLLVNQEKNRTLAALDQLADEQQKTARSLAAETVARRQARDALNTLTDDMIGEIMARQVELTDADRMFFRRVARQIRSSSESPTNDGPGSLTDEGADLRADSLMRLGNLQRRLGEFEAAEKTCQSAIDIWTRLLAGNPNITGYRRNLAAVTANLGLLSAETGDDNKALERYSAAINVLESIPASDDSIVEVRRELAKLLGNRANTCLRLKQTERAEAEYRKSAGLFAALAADRTMDGGIAMEQARSAAQFGSLQSTNPETREQAISTLRDAVQVFSRELESQRYAPTSMSNPDVEMAGRIDHVSPQLRNELSTLRGNLALALARNRQFGEAATEYRKAIEEQVELVDQFPALAALQLTLSRLYTGLARSQVSGGQGADRELDLARTILETLVERFPARPQFQVELAGWMELRADIARAGNLDGAEQWMQQALKIRRDVSDLEPDNPAMATDMLAAQINLANFQRVAKRYQSAIGTYRDVLDRLGNEPANNDAETQPEPSLRNRLTRTAWFGLADSLAHEKQFAEALVLWTKLCEDRSDRNWIRFEMQRAICTVRAGQIDEGVSIARGVSELAGIEPVIHYDIACALAVAAACSPAPENAEAFAASAMESLQRAADDGFFENPAMRSHAATDPDLDGLRSGERFRKFCEEQGIK